ncbi:MAG: hypothetical protein EXQ60_07115 [Candidatus Nanopelagicales bacterium]|nr:hypothetical protein [Candidatus Nanopelagicales bacterium]
MSENINPAEDEAYRALFRPADDKESAPDTPPVTTPTQSRKPADTGRLFRSNRAETAEVAIVALGSDQVSKLRTVQVSSSEPAPLAGLLQPPPSRVAPAVIAITPDANSRAVQVFDKPSGRKARRTFRNAETATRDRGLRPIGVYVVVIGATLLISVVDIFVGGTGLGLVTGLALLISSAYAALTVRTGDLAVAVIAPPIAFFIAAITIGQFGVTVTGGVLIGRAVAVFFTLADNWLWVIGSTLIALVIVIVRAQRR